MRWLMKCLRWMYIFFKDLTDGTGESGKDSHTCSPAIDGVTRGVFSTVTG